MPYDVNFYPPARLVYAIGYGVILADEMMKHWTALAADPRYQAPMKKLVRYLPGNVRQITVEESRTMPAFKRRFDEAFANERCAMIASTDLHYGMSRMFESFADDGTVEHHHTVRSAEEGLAWLEINTQDPEFQAWFAAIEARVEMTPTPRVRPPAETDPTA